MIHAIAGIVIRDLHRLTRQRGRFIGGLARPFLWVFLVGAGFEGIARTGDGYRAFAYPGGIAMAALFGGMLTGISTVYDREFGMLRLLLASPFGVRAALLGRLVSATLVGTAQGTVVLALAPLVLPMSPALFATGLLALVLVSAASAALGLLVASRLASVDSFGGVINVVTKSGTNELHGSAFWFLRQRFLNANTFINNSRGIVRQPYDFNQFGGTVGGPADSVDPAHP